ncbi:MAG: PAS domain-containing protein [Anaerolineae bacterium]|nr:PAS domain-containing protein [Anaerolineae bacterium]
MNTFSSPVLQALKTAYAFFDTHHQLVEHDTLFATWLAENPDDLVGIHLLDVLPEFFGQETELARVCQGEIPYVRLEHINHTTVSGELRYFTLTAIAWDKDEQLTLAVLVTDATEQGTYLQELMQNRNELRLLRDRLSRLNAQLEFMLNHYLPPEVAEALVKGELRPELGGELRYITILFADVRNFTSLAETLSPEHTVALLNDHIEVAVAAIHQEGGTVNQFQGDNIMAIFNAPQDQSDHTTQAIKAGIAMQRALLTHQTYYPPEAPKLHFGIGINTGPAIVGNVGARWRYTYTAIGDTVNLASRITAVTPAPQIWISQAVYEALDADHLNSTIEIHPLPAMQFKGKSQPTTLFRVRFDF